MSEFANTYMHYEDIPLLGGNLLEFLELDPGSNLNTNFTSSPTVDDCGYIDRGLLSGEEIRIDQDLKMLEGLLDIPTVPSTQSSPVHYKPHSPGSGSDSGLSSPGSAWDVHDDRFSPSPDILSLDQTFEPSISAAENDNGRSYQLFNVLPELSGIDMTTAFGNGPDFNTSFYENVDPLKVTTVAEPIHDATEGYVYSTTSPMAGVESSNTLVPETKELLEELGIKVETPVENCQFIPVPSADRKIDSGEKVSVPPYTVATDNAVDCVSESNKHKGGRKRKICSVQERRERKREQNKNAATRYRERKRSELSKRDAQLNALKDKNASLKDESNRINREIDYLRELLVEVYKLKGVIS